MWKIQGVGCCGAALSGTSAVGSQDLSGEGERQNCGLGAEGLAGAGGKSCAVSLLHVSDGHLSWKLLLPSCPSCLLALSPGTAQVHQGEVPQRTGELHLGSAQAWQNGGITELISHFIWVVVYQEMCSDL